MYGIVEIEDLLGKTFEKVKGNKNDDSLTFITTAGDIYHMEHHQDCCEHVYLEDIVGDLEDLEGSPILQAECVCSNDEPPADEYDDSYTWTFYKLATIKGSVTIRWYGSSNGYYSERAEIYKVEKPY